MEDTDGIDEGTHSLLMKRNSLNTTHSLSHLGDENILPLPEPSHSPPGGVVRGSMNFPTNRSTRVPTSEVSRSPSQSRSVSPVKETQQSETSHHSPTVNPKSFGRREKGE